MLLGKRLTAFCLNSKCKSPSWLNILIRRSLVRIQSETSSITTSISPCKKTSAITITIRSVRTKCRLKITSWLTCSSLRMTIPILIWETRTFNQACTQLSRTCPCSLSILRWMSCLWTFSVTGRRYRKSYLLLEALWAFFFP